MDLAGRGRRQAAAARRQHALRGATGAGATGAAVGRLRVRQLEVERESGRAG